MDIHALRTTRPPLSPVLTLALTLVVALAAVGIGGAGQAAPHGQAHQASAQPAFGRPPLAQHPVPVAHAVSAPLDDEDTAELLDEVGPALVDINTDTGDGGTEAGTGIVLTRRGLVLTNAHVITNAIAVHATDLGDGRTYTGRLVGADLEHDIALIQLTGAAHLRTASLGDSDTVHVGDQVASIGNAFGLDRLALGAGPITHLHRDIASTTDPSPHAEPLTGLIQARSWIRPGESGGPTVNRDGEVIGINVAYTAAADGTILPDGYAIPINQAVHVVHELLAHSTR